jgi:molecular chaperone GrpE (heat shock protein)
MNRSTSRSKPSASTADLPAAFQIDEVPDGDPSAGGLARLLEQAESACEGLIWLVHDLRMERQQGQILQEQADSARQQAERLMAEAGRLQGELAMARRSLTDQAEQAQEAKETLYCRFAGEAFRFQQMVNHLQERGMDAHLGKEFDRVRALHKRMERLLQAEDVHILDPTGSEPDGEQVDVMSYVVRPGVEADTIIQTLEPIVAQAGHVIGRGKVIVAVSPTH